MALASHLARQPAVGCAATALPVKHIASLLREPRTECRHSPAHEVAKGCRHLCLVCRLLGVSAAEARESVWRERAACRRTREQLFAQQPNQVAAARPRQ